MAVTRVLVLAVIGACALWLVGHSPWARRLAAWLMGWAALRSYAHDAERMARREEEWKALGLGRSTIWFIAVAARFAVSALARSTAGQGKLLRQLGRHFGGNAGTWAGNALVFLTSADSRLIGSRHERHRYITIGLLMIITAAQAFYAAALFFSAGLSKPFSSVIFFGVFFAVAVLLIDRSIIGYAAPIKKDKQGQLRAPRKTSAVLMIRVGFAIVAAIMMSEVLLLQVFATDIRQQIQNDHLVAAQSADSQIEAQYQARITKLQDEINDAQAPVNADQATVASATRQMNCQEYGCRGIEAGMGPGFAAARTTLQLAQQTLAAAQASLKSVTSTDQAQISQLNAQEKQAITTAQSAINEANGVLSQEQAFWQLTVDNGDVLAVRVLLSALILGIDLAPVLTKLTGRTTIHDIRAHAYDYQLGEQLRNES